MNRAEFVADDRATDSERLGTTDTRACGSGGQRSLDRLISRWRDEAERFEKHGCAEVANTYKILAGELERDLINCENELLSIKEAAAESGYSEETLRRRIRKGEIAADRSNGKKSHVKVRRGDLPTKPVRGKGAYASRTPYNPEEDARDIAQRLGGNYA